MYSDPNPPQSLHTEANLQPHGTTNITHVSEPEPRSSPPTLIALLIFLVLQLLSAIGMLVLKIVLKFIGFDNSYPLVPDLTNCSNWAVINKFYGSELKILSISLVMMAVCILLTIILIIITSRALHLSRKLPPEVFEIGQKSLILSSLYHVVSARVRAFMYILQSICVLNAIVTLGYYLSYYVNLPEDTCGWISFNKDNLLILWIIAAVLFIFAWINWIIIVLLNIKNNRDQVYKFEDVTQRSGDSVRKEENKPNNTIQQYQEQPKKKETYYYHEQPKKQQKPYRAQTAKQEPRQEEPYIIRTPYVDSPANKYTYKPKQETEIRSYAYKPQEQPEKGSYTYKPQEQPQRNYSYKPQESPQRKNYSYKPQQQPENHYSYKPQESPERRKYNYTYKPSQLDSEKPYNYEPRKSPKAYVYNERPDNNDYENPVFKDKRRDNYDSPYSRIENGPYYEGDRAPIDNRQKDRQFKRSRFNTNNYENNPSFDSKPREDHEYLKTLSRHKLDQEERDFMRANENPSRRILPENDYRPRSPNNQSYEGANKPKLHGSYFNDEAGLQRKKPEYSDQKKKRSGILNEYLRGKRNEY